MNVLRFTPERLAELRLLFGKSFYAFCKGGFGYRDVNAEFHKPLCDFLQFHDAKRKVVCGFRGCLKSSVLGAFLAWTGLEQRRSWLLVELRELNARLHLRRIEDKFRVGPTAGLLQDLYSDRLPSDFPNCFQGTMARLAAEPDDAPWIMVGSLEAGVESLHPTDLLCDDLEGAEADTSVVPNREARYFIEERAEPLLKDPAEGTIVVTGTPWGEQPLVWHLREQQWACWWQEVYGGDGKPAWPKKTPEAWCREKERAGERSAIVRRMWLRQYRLQKYGGGSQLLDVDVIRANVFRKKFVDFKGKKRLILEYPKDVRTQTKRGIETQKKIARVEASHCLAFLHSDPSHKDRTETISDFRQAKWAHTVVLVAPDLHAFVIEWWAERGARFDVAVDKWLRMYLRWRPTICTLDPVGAQTWFIHHIRALERGPWRDRLRPETVPGIHRGLESAFVARPSYRIQPDERHPGIAKEEHITQRLEIPLNLGYLHLPEKGAEAIWGEIELLGSGSKEETFDLLDSLAQGPLVWRAPPDPKMVAYRRREDAIRSYRQLVEEVTGYVSPISGVSS